MTDQPKKKKTEPILFFKHKIKLCHMTAPVNRYRMHKIFILGHFLLIDKQTHIVRQKQTQMLFLGRMN